jgi:protein gp37
VSAQTGISWTDRTWNPVVGCTKVSQGCKHCYAKTLHDMRHKAFKAGKLQNFPQYAEPFETVQLLPDRLAHPLGWRKPSRVFVNSMSDLFHESIDIQYIASVFAVMYLAPWHHFQILTKRPERMLAVLTDPSLYDRVLHEANGFRDSRPHLTMVGISDPTRFSASHVWLGVSVENQEEANKRIPLLLGTPAAVRFLSCEPLLSPVDLTRLRGPGNGTWRDALEGRLHTGPATLREPGIDWVIVGGESGKGARPMHPEWARSLRDQCTAVGVPFHFKQHGDWRSSGTSEHSGRLHVAHREIDGLHYYRVGTKRAGRELDGRVWDEFPAVRA